MAKRKKNKSEAIRQYLAKHPDEPPKNIAKALQVQPALVYNVKSMMKAQGRGKNGKKARTTVDSAANGSVDNLISAARLIQSCGSIDAAREALKAAEKVAAALEN